MEYSMIVADPEGDLILLLDSSRNVPPEPPKNYPHDSPFNSQVEQQILVSSKHLTLASPVFRDLIADAKATVSGNDKAQLKLSTGNNLAMAYLVRILHGMHDELPSTIEHYGLMQIAVLVEKYQLQKSVRFFTHSWATKLFSTFILEHGNGHIPTQGFDWMFMSWVFNMEVQFGRITHLLAAEGWYSDTLLPWVRRIDVPFLWAIATKLKSNRIDGVKKTCGVVEQYISRYQTPGREYCNGECTGHCDGNVESPDSPALGQEFRHREYCDTVVSGCLARNAARSGVLSLSGENEDKLVIWTAADVRYEIVSFNIITGCEMEARHFKGLGSPVIDHGIKTAMLKAVDDIMSGLGMDLRAMKAEVERN